MLTFLITSYASAYDDERVMANLSSDYASCAAYYMWDRAAVIEKDEKLGADFMRMVRAAVAMGTEISNEKVTIARVRVYGQQMKKDISGDFSNMAILFDKYSDMCTSLMKDPEERMEYWVAQKDTVKE